MNTPLDLIKDCKFILKIHNNIFYLIINSDSDININLFEDKNSYYIENINNKISYKNFKIFMEEEYGRKFCNIKISDYILYFSESESRDDYFLSSISFKNIRDCMKFFNIKFENIDFIRFKTNLESSIQLHNEAIKSDTELLKLLNSVLEQIPFEFE